MSLVLVLPYVTNIKATQLYGVEIVLQVYG